MEGIIFIVLALTGMRHWLVKIIPSTLKTATGVGIGLFLTEIGLSYSVGIGAITGGGLATPLALGGCPAELLSKSTGMCEDGHMTNPKVFIGLFNFFFTVTPAKQVFSYGSLCSVAELSRLS